MTFLILIVLVLVPFIAMWLDNQQTTVLSNELEKLPYHVEMDKSGYLVNNSNMDMILANNPAVESYFIHERAQINQMYFINSEFYIPNTIITHEEIASGVYCLSLSHNSLKTESNRFGIHDIEKLEANQVIIDRTFADKWQISEGDDISMVKAIFLYGNETGSYFNLGYKFPQLKVKAIVESTLIKVFASFLYSNVEDYGWNYDLYDNIEPLILVSNELFYSIMNYFSQGPTSDPINHFSIYYNYEISIQLKYDASIFDTSNIPETITQYSTITKDIKVQLGITSLYNYYYQDPIYESLNRIYYNTGSLQFYFIGFLIPTLFISYFIFSYLGKNWFIIRKKELNTLYRIGYTERELVNHFKNDLKEILNIATVFSIPILMVVIIEFDFTFINGFLLYAIVGVFLFLLFRYYIRKMKVEFDKGKVFGENSSSITGAHNQTWITFSKTNVIILFLGLSSFVIQINNFLAIEFSGIFSAINQIFSPIFPLLLILSPLFALYASLLVLFWFLSKYKSVYQKYIAKIVQMSLIDDLIRNKKEIFQFMMFLSLGLMVTIGPLIGANSLDAQDQRSLKTYYGSQYTTTELNGYYNLTDVSQKLNAINDIKWTVVVVTNVYISSPYSGGYDSPFYLLKDNYFDVVYQDTIPNDVNVGEFTKSEKSVYYIHVRSNRNYNADDEAPNIFQVTYGHFSDNDQYDGQFLNLGEIQYVPGAFINYNGYSLPYQIDTGIWSERLLLVGHLTSEYQLGESDQIKFMFTGENNHQISNTTLAQISDILGTEVVDHWDQDNQRFNLPPYLVYSEQKLIIIRYQVSQLLGILNFFLLALFIITFIVFYISSRKVEIGVLRVKGYSSRETYILLVSQLLLVGFFAFIWSFFHTLIYGLNFAQIGIRNNRIPLSIAITNSTWVLVLGIVLVACLIFIITPFTIYRKKILELMTRSN